MSVSYFIRYVGETHEAEVFMEHYRTQHSVLVQRYPRIRSCKLHHPVDWIDPVPVNKDKVFMLVELIFDSLDDLNFALGSQARLDSRADFNNFPKLSNSDIRHLAVDTERLF